MTEHPPQAIVISKKVADAFKPINSLRPWYQMPAKIDDVGKPFNIASYALLTLMVAQVTGLKPGDFVHTLGDAHIYANHFEQAELQMTRSPKPLPTMRINPQVRDLFAFKFEDFTLENYEADSSIKAPIAV